MTRRWASRSARCWPGRIDRLVTRPQQQRLRLDARVPRGREQRRDQIAGRLLELIARDDEIGEPQLFGLRRSDAPAGEAQLQSPGVADVVHERLGAGEVGHQSAAHLGHRELGVVGKHPQVTGQRQLKTRAYGMPGDGRDRDDVGPRQPGEAGLVGADRVFGGDGRCTFAGHLGEHSQVDPGAERRTLPGHHDDAHVAREAPGRSRRESARWRDVGRCDARGGRE